MQPDISNVYLSYGSDRPSNSVRAKSGCQHAGSSRQWPLNWLSIRNGHIKAEHLDNSFIRIPHKDICISIISFQSYSEVDFSYTALHMECLHHYTIYVHTFNDWNSVLAWQHIFVSYLHVLLWIEILELPLLWLSAVCRWVCQSQFFDDGF